MLNLIRQINCFVMNSIRRQIWCNAKFIYKKPCKISMWTFKNTRKVDRNFISTWFEAEVEILFSAFLRFKVWLELNLKKIQSSFLPSYCSVDGNEEPDADHRKAAKMSHDRVQCFFADVKRRLQKVERRQVRWINAAERFMVNGPSTSQWTTIGQ